MTTKSMDLVLEKQEMPYLSLDLSCYLSFLSNNLGLASEQPAEYKAKIQIQLINIQHLLG